MQVFKAFFKVLWQKKGAILLYTGIFLGLAIGLSSLGDRKADSDYRAEKYEVALFDYDQSVYSREFTDYLSEHMEIKDYEDDTELLRDSLFVRDIEAVIYIKEGFATQLEAGNVENLIEVTTLPGSVYNQSVLNYLEQYMQTLYVYRKADNTLEQAMEKTAAIMAIEADVEFTTKEVSSGYSQLYYFVLYLPYVLISCSILGIGTCIMVFSQKNIKDRMNVSSCSLIKRNAGLWVGSVVAEFVMLVFFLLVALLMFGRKLFNFEGMLMLLNAVVFALVSLGMTFLIGMLVKKAAALDMISNVVGLGFSFLGGIFVPLSVMADEVKMVSRFVPTYWYASALEIAECGTYDKKAEAFWTAIVIQLVFAVAFTAVGMAISKMRQRES